MRIARSLIGMVAIVAAACGKSESGSSTPCTAQTLPATFEAENAQLQGVQVSSEGKGFSGTGYVTGFGQVGQRVTFQVCAPESGYYSLEFGYAKGTDGSATRTLLVDGKAFPGAPVFSPLWTWSTWGNGGRRSVPLYAGNHIIALAFEQGDSGEIRLDKMVVSKGPSPSDASVRSLFMNNWKDLMVGWHAAKLTPAENMGYGPRMIAFHWAKDWPTSQIDEAQAFLRDDTAGMPYADAHQFNTKAFFTASDTDGYGEMRVQYGDYGGKALPISFTRRMIVPPGQPFVVVQYDIGNVSGASRQFSILEWADLHNKTAPSEDPADIPGAAPVSPTGVGTMSATWYPEHNAWIADMSQTNGTFLVMGSFGPMDHHVAGAPVTGGPDIRAATVQQFASAPSSLVDSRAFSGVDVGIGLSKTIMLESTGRATLAYFYGVADSLSGAKTLAQSIQGTGSPGSWVDQTSNQWKAWLSSGMGTSLKAPVPQWTQAFQIALVTNRHSQQPEYGSFLAATNPSYHYKVWVRDAAVTALAFDATGYLNEAEKYWIWMAQVQADASTASPQVPVGTWWTNYSYFARNVHIHFVEPELDSIGLFLIGIYRHHAALKARDPGRAAAFLEIVWPAAQKAADYVNNEVRRLDLALALSSGSQPTPSSSHFNFGFGPKDSSIWEEEEQYNAFTQTTYASGLHAAQLLALERGQASSAQAWAQASDTIREAIFRDTSIDPCPGNWHALKNYFIRAVQPDCTLDQRVDSSSGLLWIFGLLEAKSPRTALHRRAILLNLARGDFGYGISRYEGDGYYHTFGAGGPNEALDFMPVWPQVSMYMAMLEHWLGMDDLAANRLSWYVATTLEGYATPGEAVDWVTERPLVSTASEPVTGAWYVLALLNQLGMFDSRLP